MPLKQKVRDRMVPVADYATISQDATLKEAAMALRGSFCELSGAQSCTEAGHRTILAMDDKGRLTGILDFNSFLRALIPEVAGGLTARLSALGVSAAFAEQGAEEQDEARMGLSARVRKNAQVRVRDIMLKVRGTIEPDASLMDALKALFKNRITKLPVLENGKLAGVLRDTDLFMAVTDLLTEADE